MLFLILFDHFALFHIYDLKIKTLYFQLFFFSLLLNQVVITSCLIDE